MFTSLHVVNPPESNGRSRSKCCNVTSLRTSCWTQVDIFINNINNLT